MSKRGQPSRAHQYGNRDCCIYCGMYRVNVEAMSHECTPQREQYEDRRLGEEVEDIERVVHRLERELEHKRFTLQIEEISMAVGSLSSPGTLTLVVALLDNGSPYVAPAGSTYVFAPTVTTTDPAITFTADPTTPDQFDGVIAAGDTSTSASFTASAVDPTGATQTVTISIPFASVPHFFTLSLTQTA
jgi:hypothetical protein